MREPRTEQIALMVEEYLGLVDQPPERGGMHDAVAVPLVFRTRRRRRLGMAPALGARRVTGIRCQMRLKHQTAP